MSKIKSPWPYAILVASFTMAGCNELDLKYDNQPSVDPAPEPTAPSAASVEFVPERTKVLSFIWDDVEGATSYRLLENPDGLSGFVQVGPDIEPGVQFASVSVADIPLKDRINAEYMLEACNDVGCTEAEIVYVDDMIAQAAGYVKSINPATNNNFGESLAISSDGNTLVVGQEGDDSTSRGINSDHTDQSGSDPGSALVFVKVDGQWELDAYLKSSNADSSDYFGGSVSINADGTVIAVGARGEASEGISDPNSNPHYNAGAVYVFRKDGGAWNEETMLKATFVKPYVYFGVNVDISGDGNYILIGARGDRSNSNTINGDETDNSQFGTGSAHIFKYSEGTESWAREAYLKASDASGNDYFGYSSALSDDGSVAVIGAYQASDLTDSISNMGAAYVFKRTGSTWVEDQILFASNGESNDKFGFNVAISGNGEVIAAVSKDSGGVPGVNGDMSDNSVFQSGAVYLFKDDGSNWSEEAYIKSDMPLITGWFGEHFVDLNYLGDKLYVGDYKNGANATGFDGDSFSTGKPESGAVFVYQKIGPNWTKVDFIKATNAETGDQFGVGGAISGDESTLVFGAHEENGNGALLNGDISNNDTLNSGAVYIF